VPYLYVYDKQLSFEYNILISITITNAARKKEGGQWRESGICGDKYIDQIRSDKKKVPLCAGECQQHLQGTNTTPVLRRARYYYTVNIIKHVGEGGQIRHGYMMDITRASPHYEAAITLEKEREALRSQVGRRNHWRYGRCWPSQLAVRSTDVVKVNE
jgi:hypothetical protein